MSVYSTIPSPKGKIITVKKNSRNIKEWPTNIINKNATTLDLADNVFTDFNGMRTYPRIDTLILDRTSLESFKGAKTQPLLKVLSFENTPLVQNKSSPLMALIVFGSNIQRINGKCITKKQKKLADELRPVLLQYLIEGWVITTEKPLRIVDTQTHKRKTIFRVENPNEKILYDPEKMGYKLQQSKQQQKQHEESNEPIHEESKETPKSKALELGAAHELNISLEVLPQVQHSQLLVKDVKQEEEEIELPKEDPQENEIIHLPDQNEEENQNYGLIVDSPSKEPQNQVNLFNISDSDEEIGLN